MANSSWYIRHQGLLKTDPEGPYSDKQLKELAELGEIETDTLLYHETITKKQWLEASRFPKIAEVINQRRIEIEKAKQESKAAKLKLQQEKKAQKTQMAMQRKQRKAQAAIDHERAEAQASAQQAPRVRKASQQKEPQQLRTSSIKRRSSTLGVGCLLQFLGLACLLIGLVFVLTILAPLFLWPLGLWLLHYGGLKAYWLECGDCGQRLSRKKLKVCPSCNASFR